MLDRQSLHLRLAAATRRRIVALALARTNRYATAGDPDARLGRNRPRKHQDYRPSISNGKETA
jgi:hypothetical protein